MKTTEDFSGADFNAIREYIEGAKDYIHYTSYLSPMVEAMKSGITATTLEENLALMDLTIAQIKLRKVENPLSIAVHIGQCERTTEWCEAAKGIIKAISASSTKTRPAIPETEPTAFEHIVNTNNAKPNQLFERLKTLIKEHQNEKPYIGAMFFKCRELGYIKRNPTQAEIKRWFGDGVEVDSNYMPRNRTKKWTIAINKAETIEIFGGDEKIMWDYWRNYDTNKRKTKRK